jgi:hypothetical protein
MFQENFSYGPRVGVAQLVQSWMIADRVSEGQRDASLLEISQTDSETHTASFPVGTRSSVLESKAA